MFYLKDGPTSYVKHQSGMEKFQPKDYIPGLCSHIIYSSAEINGVFQAMLYPDQASQISELNELKTNDPDLKIILSFGSTSILDQLRFKKLASDSGLLKVFVSTVKKLVEKNPIDGLFFEWIYPHDKNDRTNYIILLRQLQETLVNSTSDKFSIGIMLPKEVEFIKNGYYISDLSKIVDYVITSPYDISYDSESVSKADKDKNVLFKETHDINTRKFSSMESTSRYLIEAGMDRSKIILGVSITAIGWNVPKSANSTIQKAVSHFSSSEHRETIYFEICNLLAEGAGPHYDVDNNVAYLEYGNEWLIYENKRSIQAKADWVKANHLGGVAIMGIHLDDFAACDLIKMYVTPIQLVSYAESQNPVLILDYRMTKDEVFNYPDEELIYISSVPNFVLRPGCTFAMLLNAYPKPERSNLYKIGSYELVALVGAHNPPVTSGRQLNPTSPAAILFGAITEFNRISPLKREPVFIINGFRGWKSTFPIYVRPSLNKNSHNQQINHELHQLVNQSASSSKKKNKKNKKKVQISQNPAPITKPTPFIEAWPNINSRISRISLSNIEETVTAPVTPKGPVVSIKTDTTYVQLSNHNLAGYNEIDEKAAPSSGRRVSTQNNSRFYNVNEWMSSSASNTGELNDLDAAEVETLEERGCKINKIVDNVYELTIPEGATGIGYEDIFGMCVDSNLTEVLVEDPFVDCPHQLRNFAMFCGFLVEKAPSLQKIRLLTKRGMNYGKFSIIKYSLSRRGVDLVVVYQDFHDREFRFNNGWRIRIGRGLDIYKWTSEYDIDYHRLDRRDCKNTTVIYIKL
uniref:GH18 domain-containing protein n=1 Tax=Acrobeloides nanus TaxID=290746 RepID=A0A914C9U2_9BILA